MPSNYYNLRLFEDTSCGDFVITAEGSSDNEYSVGCQPWPQEGVFHGVRPFFDESLFAITVYRGDGCDSAESVELTTSGTCYDVGFTEGHGSFMVEVLSEGN